MKNNKRALKRHHAARIKAKVKNYRNAKTDYDQDVVVGIVACTRAMCSCHMCGNPRKYFSELTVQEKKFIDIEKEKNVIEETVLENR